MKRILLIVILVLSPAVASAEKGWFGMHLGVGTNFQSTGNLNVGIKLRALDYCPFALEAIVSIPYGFEVMAPLYIVKTDRFKLHIVLPFAGLHIPFGLTPRISLPVLTDINLYLVVGAGAEVKFTPKTLMKKLRAKYFTVNLDWRIFMPNPIYMLYHFGDYGRVAFKQSLKEGQIWVGATLWY